MAKKKKGEGEKKQRPSDHLPVGDERDAKPAESPFDVDDLLSLLPPELQHLSREELAGLANEFATAFAQQLGQEQPIDADAGEMEDDRMAMEMEYLHFESNLPGEYRKASKRVEQLLESGGDDLNWEAELRKVIDRYPDHCSDAWLHLADLETSPEKIRDKLAKAIDACDWILRQAEDDSEFVAAWLRGYIMSTIAVTHLFWSKGMRSDALEVHAELLKIDGRDIAGQRLTYAFRLLEQRWLDELDEQLVALEDHCESPVALGYLKAICAYLRHPGTKEGADFLLEAHELNPNVADFLIGDVGWLSDDLDEEGLDDDQMEARWIGEIAATAVASVDGLGRWMRDTLEYSYEDVRPSGVLNLSWQARLSNVPASSDRWLIAAEKLQDDYYCLASFNLDEDTMVSIEPLDAMPSPDEILDFVMRSMENPDFSKPIRPAHLFAPTAVMAREWEEPLASLGVTCEFDPELEIPREVLDQIRMVMERHEESIELNASTLDLAKEIPQSDAIWQAGFFHAPIWLTDTTTPRRSWIILVVETESGAIRAHTVAEERPDEESIAKTLLKAILSPAHIDFEPDRPARIQVHRQCELEPFEDFGDLLDVEVTAADDVEALEAALSMMIQHCSNTVVRESLMESGEMTSAELLSFYDALARYYRAAVWGTLSSDRIIEFRSSAFDRESIYVTPVGSQGQHRGLLIGDDYDTILRVTSSHSGDDDAEVTLLSYGEAHEIVPLDLWLIDQHQCPVAGENAFPIVQRSFGEFRFRRPTRQELLQLEIVSRALPAFTERSTESGSISMTVQSFDGATPVTMRWIQRA